jgi:Malectin domain
LESAINRLEAERAELDALLASGVLGRTNNLVRFLTFVCERYFEGAIDEIKEYSIAVQVLGRPKDFDPQVDTIVRVTAHALRKRLEEYYRTAGARHQVRICLPPGHYVPKFIHVSELVSEKIDANVEGHPGNQAVRAVGGAVSQGNGVLGTREGNPSLAFPASAAKGESPHPNGDESAKEVKTRGRILKPAAILLALACVLLMLAWQRWSHSGNHTSYERTLASVPRNSSERALRALAGNDRAPYLDHAGATWMSDRFCSGGSSFAVSGHAIQGTDDPQLFTGGRRGIFHCNYPVPPGIYEVHLLFAETAGFQENSRFVGFSINGRALTTMDLVDDAGGNDISTTKVYPDVEPESDGTIHLDFSNPDAFLNAIEILPGIAHHALPVRIVVGRSPYHDSQGNIWLPDRYFFGGRLSRFVGDLSKVPDGALYEWHRFGHFHYVIPTATGGKYTLKLYFLEHWFGIQNGGIGGVGSRVFDVYCNGSTLLKGFDIFREAGSEPLVKSFPHIDPTPQGKIEIYFTPAVNYPSISAIEVIPE